MAIKIENENLIPNQQLELEDILNENIDLFATGLSDIPGTNLSQHAINTGIQHRLGNAATVTRPKLVEKFNVRSMKCWKMT